MRDHKVRRRAHPLQGSIHRFLPNLPAWHDRRHLPELVVGNDLLPAVFYALERHAYYHPVHSVALLKVLHRVNEERLVPQKHELLLQERIVW